MPALPAQTFQPECPRTRAPLHPLHAGSAPSEPCFRQHRSSSDPQTVFSHQLDRARLRAFVTSFLDKRDARALFQWNAADHPVAMKVNLAAIAGFEEAELAGRIDPSDHGSGLVFMLLYLSLYPAHFILQLTAGGGQCLVGV